MSKYNPIDREEERAYYARRDLRPPTVRQFLLDSVDEDHLLRAPNGQVWVSFKCDDDSYSFAPIRSRQFHDSVFNAVFYNRDTFPSPSGFRHALSCWEGAARPFRDHPALRVGGDGLRQILWDHDGGPEALSGCYQIRPDGWTDFEYGPGAFYRPLSSAPLPNFSMDPTPAFHSLLPLRRLIHAASPADWHRIVIWLLSALRPYGPYPILVLQGPSPSGKTTAAKMLRTLVDPADSPFLPVPGAQSSLLAQAFDHFVLAFDHVTAMPRRYSDILCRLSSGAGAYIGGYPQELQRPIILTVPDYANWTPTPDLARRLLVVNLAEIPKDQQLPAAQIEARYRKQTLGPAVRILCDALSYALRQQGTKEYSDQETWARLAAPILNLSGRDIAEALHPARRESPLVPNLVTFLETQPGQKWSGTAGDLLEEIPDPIKPRNANDLGQRLNRLKPSLAAAGIDFIRQPTNKVRHLHLTLQKPLSPCHPYGDPAPSPIPDPVEDWPVSDAKRRVEEPADPLPALPQPEPVNPVDAAPNPLSPCHQPEPAPDPEPTRDGPYTLDPVHVILPEPDPATRRREDIQFLRGLTKKLGELLKPDDPHPPGSAPPPDPEPEPDETEWIIEYPNDTDDPTSKPGGEDAPES